MNHHSDSHEEVPQDATNEGHDDQLERTSEGRWLKAAENILQDRLSDAVELGWSEEEINDSLAAQFAVIEHFKQQVAIGNEGVVELLQSYEVLAAIEDTPEAADHVRDFQLDELAMLVSNANAAHNRR